MNWKLNAAFAACLMVTGAQAHFRFTLGYGDAAFAALNNSTVGGQMTDGATIKVPLRGQSFRVQLWAEKIGLRNEVAHEDFYSGASALIAYDLVAHHNSTATWSSGAAFAHRKITAKTVAAAGSIVNLADNFEGYDYSSDDVWDPPTYVPDGTGHLFALSRVFRGAYTGNTQNPRLAGLSGQFGFGTANSGVGRSAKLSLGQRVRLFDVDLTSQLDASQTYGFGQGEAGLQAFVHSGQGTANGGSTSYLAGGPTTNRTGNEVGMRVNLQAVPEPGSLGALALGALLLLRRRPA